MFQIFKSDLYKKVFYIFSFLLTFGGSHFLYIIIQDPQFHHMFLHGKEQNVKKWFYL